MKSHLGIGVGENHIRSAETLQYLINMHPKINDLQVISRIFWGVSEAAAASIRSWRADSTTPLESSLFCGFTIVHLTSKVAKMFHCFTSEKVCNQAAKFSRRGTASLWSYVMHCTKDPREYWSNCNIDRLIPAGKYQKCMRRFSISRASLVKERDKYPKHEHVS